MLSYSMMKRENVWNFRLVGSLIMLCDIFIILIMNMCLCLFFI